jgi:hypothetical protein
MMQEGMIIQGVLDELHEVRLMNPSKKKIGFSFFQPKMQSRKFEACIRIILERRVPDYVIACFSCACEPRSINEKVRDDGIFTQWHRLNAVTFTT